MFQGQQCDAYDISAKPLIHDGSGVPHGTEPISEGGSRIFIGLYNMDMSVKGKGIVDPRSQRIKEMPKKEVHYLAISRKQDWKMYRLMLLAVAQDEAKYEKESISGNGKQHVKYPNNARVLFLGESQLRGVDEAGTSRRGIARHNDSPLYVPFCQMLNALVKGEPKLFGIGDEYRFNCAIMSLNSPTNLHVDKGNIGMALAFAIGEFTGGRLLIQRAPAGGAPTKTMTATATMSGSGGGSSSGGSKDFAPAPSPAGE